MWQFMSLLDTEIKPENSKAKHDESDDDPFTIINIIIIRKYRHYYHHNIS